ncbi:MAG: hypothetical protein HYR76_00110 [Ignavibacteria bacterium]|nr:hypothetical protein [Ignavibacteria bacterium]MBI3766838.1 hypothetical protein [Ignavibacteriales bacterium]
MSDISHHSDEGDDKLRKVLRDVPTVNASPDFEERLQRRINEGGSGKKVTSIFGQLLAPRRIPVFAYSLLTVIVVGVFSYYMFFRTNVTSVDQIRQIPSVDEKAKPTVPAVPQLQQGIDESHSTGQVIFKDKELEYKPDLAIPLKTQSKVSQEYKRKIDQPVEERDEAERPEDKRMKTEAQQAAPMREEVSGSQVEKAAPTQMLQQTGAQDITVPMKKQHVQQRTYNYSVQSQHSSALSDSLRKDSLQRVQREVQMLQQKAKVKKPDH